MTQETQKAGRRNLLKGAAVAASAMSVPMISTAQTISWRFQSTWPAKDIFHEFAQDLAKKINEMAGNRLKIEVLPAGAVVPAFQLLDAVSKGTLDGGHGVIAYWYGKSQAVALWGSGPILAVFCERRRGQKEYQTRRSLRGIFAADKQRCHGVSGLNISDQFCPGGTVCRLASFPPRLLKLSPEPQTSEIVAGSVTKSDFQRARSHRIYNIIKLIPITRPVVTRRLFSVARSKSTLKLTRWARRRCVAYTQDFMTTGTMSRPA